jgi:uroporphyrinogen decarboxylase
MIENYQSVSFEDIEVIIPDYDNLNKVLIEIFALDPEQCAACTYMVNIVKDNFDEIADIADLEVYKYNIRDDIARTMKMGITNLPTMCINGKPKWVSLIPGKEELISEVRKAYNTLKQ